MAALYFNDIYSAEFTVHKLSVWKVLLEVPVLETHLTVN